MLLAERLSEWLRQGLWPITLLWSRADTFPRIEGATFLGGRVPRLPRIRQVKVLGRFLLGARHKMRQAVSLSACTPVTCCDRPRPLLVGLCPSIKPLGQRSGTGWLPRCVPRGTAWDCGARHGPGLVAPQSQAIPWHAMILRVAQSTSTQWVQQRLVGSSMYVFRLRCMYVSTFAKKAE